MQQIHPLRKEISDTAIEIQKQHFSSNFINYSFGLSLMVLNKFRHEIQGYKSARGINNSEVDRVIQHCFNVVRRWTDYLEKYQVGASNMVNKNILELGPGADLGVGLITLAEGAKNYYSLDVHNLIKSTPAVIYGKLFEYLESIGYSKTQVNELQNQFEKFNKGKMDRLNFLCRKDFDASVFKDKNIDMVVSNAAFQQFDDPAKTIRQVSKVVSSGAYFVSLIDLGTHTRFIKSRDPLNIYRYPNSIYNLLRFSGSPNRMRPIEYKKALEKNGWTNVKIFPRLQLEKDYLGKVNSTLHPKFRIEENNIQCLTAVVCATKK